MNMYDYIRQFLSLPPKWCDDETIDYWLAGADCACEDCTRTQRRLDFAREMWHMQQRKQQYSEGGL